MQMREIGMHTKSTAYVLDSGAIGAGREMTVNEDASGKADLALETLGVELVRKDSGAHCWGGRKNHCREEADFINVGVMTLRTFID